MKLHGIIFDLDDVEALREMMDSGEKGVKKAVGYTLKDIRKRLPGWVAKETSAEYNIKQSEINSSKKGTKAVSISISTMEESMEFVYRGTTLTPIHFSMTPKKPRFKPTKKKVVVRRKNGFVTFPVNARYPITYEIKRGSRKRLHGEYDTTPFLAPVQKGSKTYIPFQRRSEKGARKNIESIRTISVPQMIGSEKVTDKINVRVESELMKRMGHHLARLV